MTWYKLLEERCLCLIVKGLECDEKCALIRPIDRIDEFISLTTLQGNHRHDSHVLETDFDDLVPLRLLPGDLLRVHETIVDRVDLHKDQYEESDSE